MTHLRLEGAKARVKLFSEEHLTEAYVGWLNDPVIVRLSGQRFKKHTMGTCRIYWESFASTPNLFLVIEEKQTGAYIGTMSVHFFLPHNTADLGIMIGDRNAWGKGIGLDAWELVSRHLFRECGVRKITAGTVRSNFGMVSIMEKSGMALEGARLRQQVFDGIEEDVLLYGKFA